MKITQRLILLFGFFVTFMAPALSAAGQVGEIKYARGAVTVQKLDGSSVRLVGKGDKIKQGEVIKTGSKSFAIVNLADKTRMTLRPDTSFAVESMNAVKTSEASAILRLFRGGFRAITGFISKKNPNGYKVKTTVATIGIRGTEFDARLCDKDCANENKKLEEKLKKQQEKVIGRVVYKRGTLKANDLDDKQRKLITRSDLFEGDLLSTGKNSYAILVFKDKSRISLKSLTDFRIDEHQFNKKDTSKISALYSLLRGGLRTATGLIGKLSPKKYRMRTRIATIGIRGTGYSLLCSGPCAGSESGDSELPKGDGLYAHVWDGSITLGDTVLKKGQAAFVKNASTDAAILPRVPTTFKVKPVPDLNDEQFDNTDFSSLKSQNIKPGLYVSVTKGEVEVSANTGVQKVLITPGQAAFASVSGQQVKELDAIPPFQSLDQFPTPDNYQSTISSLGEMSIGGDVDDKGQICEIK